MNTSAGKPIQKILEDFNNSMVIWVNELEQSNFIRICTKPTPTSWSLGQVCNHLIEATSHFLDQVTICLSTHDDVMLEMTQEAKDMFANDEFPDEIIEGPASNADTAQPASKELLLHSLLTLQEEFNRLGKLLLTSTSKGKTKHPGLNYFNANEWFQFAEMHFRHHLRQKRRIEELLENLGVTSGMK